MKKVLFILGLSLLAAALISFGISLWFHHMGGSVLDGTASLYARLFRRQQFFLWLGIGLSVSGAALFGISLLMQKH
ncbi:MAG: hypothetical protein II882_07660 [Lachnospiraceae bacterium]|nr:hypothetical protein [Lachnospiraceae bacterium]